MVGSNSHTEEFNRLQKRYHKLEREKIRADERLKSSEEELRKYQELALEKFGTDDPDELLRRLDDLERENQEKLVKYREDLDAIDQQLTRIEKGNQQ